MVMIIIFIIFGTLAVLVSLLSFVTLAKPPLELMGREINPAVIEIQILLYLIIAAICYAAAAILYALRRIADLLHVFPSNALPPP